MLASKAEISGLNSSLASTSTAAKNTEADAANVGSAWSGEIGRAHV